MSDQVAQCACGRLRVTIVGEPLKVLVCHCDFCQKRTGSVMEVAAWYLDEAVVAIEGESKVFNGRRVNGVGPSAPGAGDVGIEYHFCTTCGSTVYWTFEDTPGITGISVGNFVDPTFHAPTLELHVAMRHRWVAPVAGAAQFDEWPPDYSWV